MTHYEGPNGWSPELIAQLQVIAEKTVVGQHNQMLQLGQVGQQLGQVVQQVGQLATSHKELQGTVADVQGAVATMAEKLEAVEAEKQNLKQVGRRPSGLGCREGEVSLASSHSGRNWRRGCPRQHASTEHLQQPHALATCGSHMHWPPAGGEPGLNHDNSTINLH